MDTVHDDTQVCDLIAKLRREHTRMAEQLTQAQAAATQAVAERRAAESRLDADLAVVVRILSDVAGLIDRIRKGSVA